MERLSPVPCPEAAPRFPFPTKSEAEAPSDGKPLFLDPAPNDNGHELSTETSVSHQLSSPSESPAPFNSSIAQADSFLSLRVVFDARLERLERMHKRLSIPEIKSESLLSQPVPQSSKPSEQRRSSELLPGTLQALERLTTIPLLPAPPDFEEVFKPFEPMFHTIFYRKYPWYIREDATQEALLGLWQSWKRDMSLLDQSRAYVTQAALWRASPWRKKRAKIDANEAPIPKHERYFSGGKQAPSPDTTWVQRIDLVRDVELAIQQVRTRLNGHPDCQEMGTVLQDFLTGVSIAAGRKRSSLTWRVYADYRKAVVGMLREALAEYQGEAPANHNGQVTIDRSSQIIYQGQGNRIPSADKTPAPSAVPTPSVSSIRGARPFRRQNLAQTPAKAGCPPDPGDRLPPSPVVIPSDVPQYPAASRGAEFDSAPFVTPDERS